MNHARLATTTDLRVRPLPRRRAPIPVERPGEPTVLRLSGYGRYALQGTLALELSGDVLPLPGPPDTPELDHSRRSRLEAVADAEVRRWAATFAQAVIEAVAGQRPVSQLVRWTAADVYRDLDRRVSLVRRAAEGRPRSTRPQVRSVHVCRPTPKAAEVSVHLRHGTRSRALALRLERRDDRWQCTVLQFG